MTARTAHFLLAEICNRRRNSDIRADDKEVLALIDGLLKEIADLKSPPIQRMPVFERPKASEMMESFIRNNPEYRYNREFHQLIGAFVAEGQKPLHDLLMDISARIAWPPRIISL